MSGNCESDRYPITINYCIETAPIELEVLDSEDVIIPRYSDFIATFSLLTILSAGGNNKNEKEAVTLDCPEKHDDFGIMKSTQSIPGVMPPPKSANTTANLISKSASAPASAPASTSAKVSQVNSSHGGTTKHPCATYATNKDSSLLLPVLTITNPTTALSAPPVTIKGFVNKQFPSRQNKSIFKNVYCVLEVKSGVSILSCYKSSADHKLNKTISVDYLSNSDMKVQDGNIVSINITKNDEDEEDEDYCNENADDINSISSSNVSLSSLNNKNKVYTVRMELVDVPSIPDYKQKWIEALTKHVGYSNRKRAVLIPSK